MAKQSKRDMSNLTLRMVNAVAPNLFREAKVAFVVVSVPIDGVDGAKVNHIHGPVRYSVKGVDLKSIHGKKFTIEFFQHLVNNLTLDLVNQLQELADAIEKDNAPVSPPEGDDVK